MGLTLIKAATASGSPAVISFVDGTGGVVFDNTYNEYQFQFVNIHLATLNAELQFQVNATDDAGGDYDASPMITTIFGAYHNEDDGSADIDYFSGHDIANAATFQNLTYNQEVNADSSMSGSMTLYDPSSTTYVKHFTARTNGMGGWGASLDNFVAGYINDTTAIDEIRFKSSDGNIDAGTIYMYGIS
tara:strand:+ start:824 stop:1387 length:564 start_codon:yes stop_codon:yes gene_type:complete